VGFALRPLVIERLTGLDVAADAVESDLRSVK
jgi:hypothetical protein